MEKLIELWQERQKYYEYLAEKHKEDEHNNKKFKYKAIATRDCWKGLNKCIEKTNNKIYCVALEESDRTDYLLFATRSEEKARSYIEKFKRLQPKIQEFYLKSEKGKSFYKNKISIGGLLYDQIFIYESEIR